MNATHQATETSLKRADSTPAFGSMDKISLMLAANTGPLVGGASFTLDTACRLNLARSGSERFEPSRPRTALHAPYTQAKGRTMSTTERNGLTITVYRYGFRAGYYAEARDSTGSRVAFTGVFRGRGSKARAIEAAVHEATTGNPAPTDVGCTG